MKNSHSLSWHHNFHLMDYCNWTFTSTVHSKTKIMRCFRRWYSDGWSSFLGVCFNFVTREKVFMYPYEFLRNQNYERDRWSYSCGLFLFFFKRVCLNFIARKGFLCIHMIPTWIFLFSETFLREAQMVWQTTQQQYILFSTKLFFRNLFFARRGRFDGQTQQQKYFSETFFFARRGEKTIIFRCDLWNPQRTMTTNTNTKEVFFFRGVSRWSRKRPTSCETWYKCLRGTSAFSIFVLPTLNLAAKLVNLAAKLSVGSRYCRNS